MFSIAHLIGLMLLPQLTHSAASNSLSDCQTVANQFSNTVSGPVSNIVSTVGVNVSCPQIINATSCPGTMINNICVWQQKLSVSCVSGSPVRIRVQSNGLPRRCTILPSFAAFAERNIDFEVNFNPDVSVNSPNQAPTTAAALTGIICNISTHSSVPSASAYVLKPNSMPINVLAGVALDGVSILNVNSINQVDPFYPPTGYSPEGADQCLSHPTGAGEFHYHIASGCILNPPQGNLSGCSPNIGCSTNVAGYSISSFSSYTRLTVIGIAKDGHVIYGPYTSSGTQVTSGFDICNGMFYDTIGNYGYFVTQTYPYITGCFGPGNYPSFKPNCTTNPANAYTMSTATSTSASTTTRSSDTTSLRVPHWFAYPCLILMSALRSLQLA